MWVLINIKENPLEKMTLAQEMYDLLPGNKRSLYKLL